MHVPALPPGMLSQPAARFGRRATDGELKVLARLTDGLPLDPNTCIVIDHGKHPVWNMVKRVFTGEAVMDLFRLLRVMASRTWQGAKARFSKNAEPLKPLVLFLWNQDPPRFVVRRAKDHIRRTMSTGEDHGIRVFALAAKEDETKALAMIFRITPGIRSKKQPVSPPSGDAAE